MTMIVRTIKADSNHWTTNWVPMSYIPILSRQQLNHSVSFVWSLDYTLLAICRAYYIDQETIEMGDVWLHDKYRGHKINGEKVSVLFMQRVIRKIWKTYPNATQIRLVVAQDNIPAIKLYRKLGFYGIRSNVHMLGMKNGVKMCRKKYSTNNMTQGFFEI